MWAIDMVLKYSKTILLAGVACLSLSACGDNYVAIKTTEHFPYGNQRTAGSGVAYVLAKMLPERSLNTVPAAKIAIPAMVGKDTGNAPILGADAVFQKVQKK